MNAVASFLKTLAGLFVDDGWLAATIVVWIVIGLLALQALPDLALWWAPLFTLGVLLLLAASVMRAAMVAARKRLAAASR
jgi:hypothetical protein